MSDSRKRLLYIALAAVGVYLGGSFAWTRYVDGPLKDKQQVKAQWQDKIKKKKKDVAKSKEAAAKLVVWETMSLPSETELARSLYRTWLLELVEKSEFHSPHVDSGAASNRKGFYETLGFTVRGKGSLQHLVRFLFDFYRAGHLHRIQSLSLTPFGKSGDLDIIMSIEALALPKADRKDELSEALSNRLSQHSLEDYGIIARRNVFGLGGESDPSHQAFLTAVTRNAGEPEIWITLRGKDKLLKLQKGGRFEIGQFNGTVLDILDDDMVFESSGEHWLLSVGEPLADAVALPPEY